MIRRDRRSARVRPSLRVEGLEARNLLTGAGRLDPSFGDGGSGYVAVPVGSAQGQSDGTGTFDSVAVQPDGKILAVGGDLQRVLALVRIDPDGSPDASFGQDGEVTVLTGDSALGTFQGGDMVVVLPDGRIDVVATVQFDAQAAGTPPASGPDLAEVVLQYNPDGTLDTSYGEGGEATIATGSDYASPSYDAATALPDGSLILAGTSADSAGDGVVSALEVAPDGTLDPNFGTAGVATIPIEIAGTVTPPEILGVAAQPDGKIVLGGDLIETGSDPSNSYVTNTQGLAIRLDADGTPDPTFGGGSASAVDLGPGIVAIPADVATPSAPGDFEGNGLAIQPDGRIVLGGTLQLDNASPTDPNSNPTDVEVAVDRLNSDGTPDTTFGTGGQAVLVGPSGTDLNTVGIGLEPDGSIVAAGTTYPDPTAPDAGDDSDIPSFTAHLDADGSPAPDFGDGTTPGLATLDPSGAGSTVTSLAIPPDGGIVAAGYLDTTGPDGSTGQSMMVARVLAQPSDAATNGPIAAFPTIIAPPATSPIGPITPIITTVAAPTGGRGVTPAVAQAPSDYDGSGRSDLAAYLPASGSFVYRKADGSADVTVPFGIPGPGNTLPAPGDYTGAGHTEIAAYLPTLGDYAIRPADGSPDELIPFGIPGSGRSIPAPGDYEGTGEDDIAVYMPSLGAFGIRPSGGGPDQIVAFGQAGPGNSIPAPADYFGTGQDDIAVYLPSLGAFAIRNPTTDADEIIPFGIPGAGNSIPVPGDYDGSGKAELAVYLPTLGEFAYRPADGGPDVVVPLGMANGGDVPVVGDYAGTGRDQFALFDPTAATFTMQGSGGGSTSTSTSTVPFGSPGVGVTLPTSALTTVAVASTVSTGVATPGGPSEPRPSGAVFAAFRMAPSVIAQANPADDPIDP